MIMPKNREVGARLTANSRTKLADANVRSDRTIAAGRPAVQTDAKTVELSFVLPLNDGMALLEQLRSGSSSERSPIVLWTGRQGEMEIAVRQPGTDGSPSVPRAIIPVKADRAATPPASARPDMEMIELGDLSINPGRHEVIYKGKAISQLTFTEFGILHFLARHPGWVFNRQQIVAGVRGEDYPVTDRAVDVQVAGLRKKLGDAGEYVQTVRGVGYRFRD